MSDRPLPRRRRQTPEPVDYTDPKAAEDQQSAADMKEDRLREVESAILSTPGGREWLWGVLNGMHVFEKRMSVTGSANEGEFWDGQREAGMALMRRFVRVSPEHFARMFIEWDR